MAITIQKVINIYLKKQISINKLIPIFYYFFWRILPIEYGTRTTVAAPGWGDYNVFENNEINVPGTKGGICILEMVLTL